MNSEEYVNVEEPSEPIISMVFLEKKWEEKSWINYLISFFK